MTSYKTMNNSEIDEGDMSINSQNGDSVLKHNHSALLLSETKILEDMQKKIMLLQTKEDNYLNYQKTLLFRVKNLEDKLEEKIKQNTELIRELQYSNRQVEDLKNELIRSEISDHKSENISYSHHF
jgi:hypothetical protein